MLGLDAAEQDALLLSLKVSAVALCFTLPLAIFIAYALTRWRFPGRAVLRGLVYMPLVMPPVVTGYALLLLFGRKGPVGQFLEQTFGLVFAFRWTGAALAAAIMTFPVVVRPIQLAFEAVDEKLEKAAETLGAGRVVVFLTVSLPLALPGIFAAAVLGFAKALGEFGATITFVSNIPGETTTLSLMIYTLLQTPGADAMALRLTLIAMVVALGAVILSEFIAHRLAERIRGEQ